MAVGFLHVLQQAPISQYQRQGSGMISRWAVTKEGAKGRLPCGGSDLLPHNVD